MSKPTTTASTRYQPETGAQFLARAPYVGTTTIWPVPDSGERSRCVLDVESLRWAADAYEYRGDFEDLVAAAQQKAREVDAALELDHSIRAAVKALSDEFPQLDLSFGYIGNCGRDYDDRSWMVFTNRQTKPTADFRAAHVSWHIGGTDALPKALERIKARHLHDWCIWVAANTVERYSADEARARRQGLVRG